MGRTCGVFWESFIYGTNSWKTEKNCTMEKTCFSVLRSVLAMPVPICTLSLCCHTHIFTWQKASSEDLFQFLPGTQDGLTGLNFTGSLI